MPRTPVVPDIQKVTFKGIDLFARITTWADSRKPSLAVHTMLKRDGARVEVMGREPHSIKLTLYFIGPKWREDYLKLQSSIDSDPKGVLVHPVIGEMRVACQGLEGATMDMESGANTYMAPISFIEDNLDDKVDLSRLGISGRRQEVDDQCDLLETDLSAASSATQAAGTLYRGVAQAFAAAAMASAAFSIFNSLFDSSLRNQLGDVRINATGCRDAIQSDTTFDSDAERYTAIARAERIYAACLGLVAAFKAQIDQPALYVVPTTIHIVALAADFYGPDGLSRIGQIMENNIGRIPNPSAIARGTKLLMAPRTV